MGAESMWEPHTPSRPEPPPPTPPPALSRRRWYQRPLAVTALVFVLLFGAGAGLLYVASERLGDNVTRVQNAFEGIDEANRPPPTGALTFLLVGTDSRSEATAPGVTSNGGHSDADVVMVAHVAPDRRSATVVSIPRDSVVDIPDHDRGRMGGAYALGGPSLLIRTVEHASELRIDHFAVIDFAGFRAMVDAVGGIDVDPALHLDGAQALAYVRDRSTTAPADRALRQQNALRAMLEKAASGDTLSDPIRLYDFLDAAAQSVGVDDTLSNGGMRALALKLSDLRAANVLFVRTPVASIGQDRGGAVIRLDPGRSGELWTAVRQESAGAFVQQNPRDALGPLTQ